MFDLFAKPPTHKNNLIITPNIDLVKRVMDYNLVTRLKYYRERIGKTPNTFILNRILRQSYISIEYEDDLYITLANNLIPMISRGFRLTSEITPGTLRVNKTLTKPIYTTFIIGSQYFFPPYVDKNWTTMDPVKYLYHNKAGTLNDFINLRFSDPLNYKNKPHNLNFNNENRNLEIIYIDLPLLLYQYKCFVKYSKLNTVESPFVGMEEITEDLTGEPIVIDSLETFVYQYVLPNMTKSYNDITLFNRLINLSKEIPLQKTTDRTSVVLFKMDNVISSFLTDYLSRIKDHSVRYDDLLFNLPSTYKTSLLDSLLLPEIFNNRNNYWALYISKLFIMEDIIDLLGEKSLDANPRYIRKIKRDIRYLRSSTILNNLVSIKRNDNPFHTVNATLDKLYTL